MAGIDESSINASYFLKIDDVAAMPFADIEITDLQIDCSQGTVASIDPSYKGGDYTAISIMRFFGAKAVFVGFVWKKAWYDCLEDLRAVFVRFNVKMVFFENNVLGEEPIRQLNNLNLDCKFVGFVSLDNKAAKIQNAGMFANSFMLSKESSSEYISQILDYEAGAEYDDAPDSMANLLINLNLMESAKGKKNNGR
ncbi:MAG: hypothetical protein LBV16_09290 [Elusimicrobiota bacterium]|nr:hypothetical protein [Elusimicrobiota bacterium]